MEVGNVRELLGAAHATARVSDDLAENDLRDPLCGEQTIDGEVSRYGWRTPVCFATQTADLFAACDTGMLIGVGGEFLRKVAQDSIRDALIELSGVWARAVTDLREEGVDQKPVFAYDNPQRQRRHVQSNGM